MRVHAPPMMWPCYLGVDLARRDELIAARMTVPDDDVDPDTAPWTASEDFGAFTREVPGCFALLGSGDVGAAGGTPLHNPDYDFNDEILPIGVAYYANLVRTALAPSGSTVTP